MNKFKTINLYDEFLNEWSEKYFMDKYTNIIIPLSKYIVSDTENPCYIIMTELSGDPNITLNTVRNHPEVEWCHDELTLNPNVTLNMVRNNPDINWSEFLLGLNPNINLEIIRKNPDIDWDFYTFSMNENVTWKIVKDNPDIKWVYSGLSMNPNITLDVLGNDLHLENDWVFERIRSEYKIAQFKSKLLERELVNKIIREKFQEWFKNSELKMEIMAAAWHPKNLWKFKYLDSDTFGKGF